MTNTALTFLGRGWAFPPHSAQGQIAVVEYEEDVRQSILVILGTNPGERLMRPSFGAGLNAFLFEPINSNTMAALRKRVQEALIDFEPRIAVDNVRVAPDPSFAARLLIEIDYRIRSTNSVRNLVYPFYLDEAK